jgi:opacity protein-like surface antigen
MRARELVQAVMMCATLLAAREVTAEEEPLDPGTKRGVTATIGNDALQLGYESHNDPVSNADMDLGLLITTDRQFLGTAALMFGSNFGIAGLTMDFGPIGYLGWLEGQGKTQIAAIGGGASVRYDILPSQGLAVVGHGFFSPSILTFGAANNVYDFLAGAEFRASDKVTILAGYRWLKITLNNQPDNKLLNEVYAGVRYRLK